MPASNDCSILEPMKSYYNCNAEEYIKSTQNIDMTPLWKCFEELLPTGGRILDAGCGSGRDSLHFIKSGYNVSAFDSSYAMADKASALTKIKVRTLSFQKMDYIGEFDGIWACASLLHIPRNEMNDVLLSLHRALAPNGVMYCSFKNRDVDFTDGERSFTCFTVDGLRSLLSGSGLFQIIDIFTSFDWRNECWTNAIVRKATSD